MEFSDWIGDARNVVFLVIALLMVITAIRVVTSPNVVHAALMLVVTLAGSAALFVMLGAEFVAWTVVLVYIGAVIVLFLFGLMITRAPTGRDPVQLDHPRRWPAALIALATFVTIAWTTTVAFEDATIPEGVARAEDLGDVLFSRYVIPFEAVSFVLLAALIGGIVLARKDVETVIVNQFLVLAALLFSIGIYGVLARRNAVLVLLSVELMLTAVNINLVAFGSYVQDQLLAGQAFALFVIAVAAAEVGIGLAIVVLIFRNRSSANVDELDLLKW